MLQNARKQVLLHKLPHVYQNACFATKKFFNKKHAIPNPAHADISNMKVAAPNTSFDQATDSADDILIPKDLGQFSGPPPLPAPGEFTGMRLVFLGTSSSKPTAYRNVSGLALQLGL